MMFWSSRAFFTYEYSLTVYFLIFFFYSGYKNYIIVHTWVE